MYLSFSAGTKVDLFRLLWRLPIFHSIEAPVRYFVPVVIFLISLIGGMVFSICDKLKLKFVIGFFVAAIIVTTADLLIINGTQEISFPISITQDLGQKSFFQVKNSRQGDKVSPLIPKSIFLRRSWEWTLPSQYELECHNIGKINWYGNIHLGEYSEPKFFIDWNQVESIEPKNFNWVLNPEYKGEIYFLNNPDNKVQLRYFSPNKIIANVDLAQPDTLIINQNYDKYWRSDFSRPINHSGLLSLALERRGTYSIEFVYVPLSFYSGLAVSLATLILIIIWLFNNKRL
jgi:hypothetical protein